MCEEEVMAGVKKWAKPLSPNISQEGRGSSEGCPRIVLGPVDVYYFHFIKNLGYLYLAAHFKTFKISKRFKFLWDDGQALSECS